jgi:ADP-ribosylglycohydrolase
MLGKPVEGWHRERIFKALQKDGRFPLTDYFEVSTIRAGGKPIHPFGQTYCTRGHFDRMERDDDTDYTILGVHYLKTCGAKFTTANVAHEWQRRLPYLMTYTAERAAYRNLINHLPLDQVPIYRNPFREWIGAQIRADGFGYCAAGLPELAAEFAYRDAALSHVKNGIYGEMLFAAMIAAAAVCDDLHEVIEIGLSQIPATCRLGAAVRDVIQWAGENRNWQDTLDAIHRKYCDYHPLHTINNACLVIMGLLHGRMDFGKTICMTVMGGWDTDCTGATAGSVLGAMLGADRLPPKWIRPLNNRIESVVIGYNDVRITDIADMALEVNKRLRLRSA